MSFGKAAFFCISLFGGIGAARADPGANAQKAPLPPERPADLSDPSHNKDEADAREMTESSGQPGRRAYWAMIRREADKNGLPADVADAVTAIESGYDPTVIGGVGEIGLMQVRPETAAMMGFKGDERELAKPEINIHYGVTYLAAAWRLANGDLCRALMKYRAGHGEELMSPLSATYCGRARAHLAAIGSPFAAGASVPFVYDAPRLSARGLFRGPRIRTAAVSAAFWAAHDARVRAISRQIEAKWRRMAAR